MPKISSAPAQVYHAPVFVTPAPAPKPAVAPATTVKAKAASFSGSSTTGSKPAGKPRSESVNHGHASTAKPAAKKNAQGQTLNPQGKPINAGGFLINEYNQRINSQGHAINDQHHLIDKQNRLVNKDGYLVDALDRPLNKNGKPARSMESAVKGDVAAPVGQLIPSVDHAVKKFRKPLDVPKSVEKPEIPPIKNLAELTQRMIDAEKMVKSGVISTRPDPSTIALESATSAAISGLVSAPISVGAYGASTAWGESIKASYLPIPLLPQAPGTKSIVEAPAAKATAAPETKELDAETKALYSKMDNLQVSAFASVNTSMALRLGNYESGWLPSTEWSSDPVQRMTQLEELLDRSEVNTKVVADEYEVFYKRYLPLKEPAEGVAGLPERLETAQRRLAALDKTQAGILEAMKALAEKV